MMIEKMVGLIVLTDISWLTEEPVAILQKRGTLDFKEGKLKTWSGVCQLTVVGRLKMGESFPQGLRRQIRSQLGYKISKAWQGFEFKEILYLDDGQQQFTVYGIYLPNSNFLSRIQLHPASGGLRIVTRAEAFRQIVNLSNFDPAIGVRDRDVIAMFESERKALERAFEMFGE